jgi:pimeloyl-ACP methyl ester carboxylesterase
MRASTPSASSAALRSPLAFGTLLAAASLSFLSFPVPSFGSEPSTGAVPSVVPQAPPTLHVRIGADSNACGISRPAGGAPRTGKAGLIVWLHGGMRSANREKGLEAHRGWLAYLPPRRYYVCSPSAYGGADWLTPQGQAHIEALIGHMLQAYPIDPADISMVGVSDGSLGVIAYSLQGSRALRHRVLISSAPQLVLPPENLEGQARFTQGTWDFVQGGKDRLFPADQVMPYLDRFHTLYPNARVHAFPEGEHDFSWYADHAPDLLRGFFAQPGPKKAAGSKGRPRGQTQDRKADSGGKADPKPAQSP